MKKLKTIATAVAMLIAASSFANGGDNNAANATVRAAFKKDFAAAENVNWTKKNDVVFASFQLNGNTAEAAFNENGDLIAVSRHMATSQLPLHVSVNIAEKYAGFQVAKNAVEITYEGQTNYYINVSDNKNVLRLKCASSGSISIDSKKKV